MTGVTGFIGSHLAGEFRSAGWSVLGIVRPGTPRHVPVGIDSIEAPLEIDPLARAFDGADVVVHLAGLARARREAALKTTNVIGTDRLVHAVNRSGSRLVYVSSQAASGAGTVAAPSREDDVPRPLTAYGRSKLAAEELVKAATVPWTILRPSSVYGPGDRQFLPIFRLAARGMFPLVADASAGYTLIHIDDLVRGILAATKTCSAGGVFFLGHPEPVTSADLLRVAAAAFGRRFRPWHVPAPVLWSLAWLGEVSWTMGRQPVLDRARAAELSAPGFVCAVGRAEETLDFRAVIPLEEGVRGTAAWYLAQRWI
jgi:nucleoside-diphosphate-sugar epimerase